MGTNIMIKDCIILGSFDWKKMQGAQSWAPAESGPATDGGNTAGWGGKNGGGGGQSGGGAQVNEAK